MSIYQQQQQQSDTNKKKNRVIGNKKHLNNKHISFGWDQLINF